MWIVSDSQVTDISVNSALSLTDKAYIDHFYKLDPWQQTLPEAPMGSVVISAEILPETELVKGEFYNDFARHHGLKRPMGAMLPLAGGVVANVAGEMPFASRLFEVEDKARLERVLPYVKNALRFRQRHRGHADFSPTAIDALTFGVVICDRAGRIAAANSVAECMARQGTAVSFGHRPPTVRAVQRDQNQQLAALIHAAGSGGPGGAMVLGTDEGDGPVVVLVTPLPPSLDEAGMRGRVMVSLRTARGSLSVSVGTIAGMFGLSPRQAEIAVLLCDGLSLEDIARKLGLKITTARSHLAAAFLRTGAGNQRELVRLLNRLPQVRLRQERDPPGPA